MVVWLALSLAALIGVVAIATDGGRLLTERQNIQATADAAALAAAGILLQEYASNGGLDVQGNARAAALKMAAANGITDGTNGTVTVNIPPTTGDFTGKAGYAEVIVTGQVDRSYSLLFRSGAMPVAARGVARGIVVGKLEGERVLCARYHRTADVPRLRDYVAHHRQRPAVREQYRPLRDSDG
jgi:uncharacterized membrane protein